MSYRVYGAANRPLKIIQWSTDFTGGAGGPVGLSTSGTGSANAFNVSSDTNHPGIVTLSTGSTTSGKSIAGTNNSGNAPPGITLGEGAVTLQFIFRIPTLSNGTDTFTVFAGLGDNAGGTPTDGCFFRYTDGTNGGRFQCVTRSNGSETATDSGVTVVAGTWYKGKISVNAAGSSVVFALDSGSGYATVATTGTNIPTGVARSTGLEIAILKSAGTSSLTLDIDLVDFLEVLTTER